MIVLLVQYSDVASLCYKMDTPIVSLGGELKTVPVTIL